MQALLWVLAAAALVFVALVLIGWLTAGMDIAKPPRKRAYLVLNRFVNDSLAGTSREFGREGELRLVRFCMDLDEGTARKIASGAIPPEIAFCEFVKRVKRDGGPWKLPRSLDDLFGGMLKVPTSGASEHRKDV